MKIKQISVSMIPVLISLLSLQCFSAPQNRGESYKKNDYWFRYQHFYSEELRFDKNNFPKEEFKELNGHHLHIDRYFSEKKNSNCKIIMVHGAGGNGRVLGNFAIGLKYLNCEIIAPDLPGYGHSVPNANKQTLYEDWVSTMSEFINSEKKENAKVYLFGLSMGGMLAYHIAAFNGRVDGVIATTLIDPRDQDVRDTISKNLFLSRIGIPINHAFTLITSDFRFPIKWFTKMELITNDPNFSQVFENDPYAGGSVVSLGFLNSYMYYNPKIEPESFETCPILLLHPSLDPWTPVNLSETFFNKIKTKKRFLLLEGAGHLPYEEPGKSQLFQEVQNFVNE